MATFADLFTTCYLTGRSDAEFSKVRVHYRGADEICRTFGATALTIGSDIYFRDGAFAPHTAIRIAPGTRCGVPGLLARCRDG